MIYKNKSHLVAFSLSFICILSMGGCFNFPSANKNVQPILTSVLKGSGSNISSIYFSDSGKFLVGLDESGIIFIWNSLDGAIIRKFKAAVGLIKFLPHQRKIALLFGDGIKSFDIDSGTSSLNYKGSAYFFEYSDDCKNVAAATRHNEVANWDVISRRKKWVFKNKIQVEGASFSPDGKLISIYDNERIKILSAQTGDLLTNLYAGTSPIYDVVFSNDSKEIKATLQNGTMLKWKLKSLKLKSIPGRYTNYSYFSENGEFLVSLIDLIGLEHKGKTEVIIRSTSDGHVISDFVIPLTSVSSISSDGSKIALVFPDRSVHVFLLTSQQ